ncbi:MAG: M28 family peptidase [Bacteroidota bacterium]
MLKNFSLILSVFISLLMISSCGNGSKNNNDNDTTKTTKNINVPDFNADSAYTYTAKQVSFGPRVTNTDAHKKCAEYLISMLKVFCDTVYVQESKAKAFDGTLLNFKNIIGSIKPGINNRIFISSHWDSRPFADYDPDEKNFNTPIDGANDGASGVGVIIELARLLHSNPPPIGVDFILFDAEDYGQPEKSDFAKQEDSWCLGSQYWSKTPHVKDYYAKFGILLDMVGAENATFTKEGTSLQYAPDITKKVLDAGIRSGYSDYFILTETSAITDDHLYINMIAKIPTVDIVHRDSETKTGFFKYWHTTKDNIDCINKNTLKAVGQTVLTVIFEEEAL